MTWLPRGAASIVVSHGSDGRIRVLAAGPFTRARYKRLKSVPLHIQFTLEPNSARVILGVSLHELADRVVPLEDLWGASGAALRDALGRGTGDLVSVVAAMELVLGRRQAANAGQSSRSLLVLRATQALDRDEAADAPIHVLAHRLGVSDRQLRQSFREQVGISPKRYARISRIRRVVARAGTAEWGRLAADHGFYDQAHLNAEFHDLLLATPTDYLAREVPIAPSC